MNDRKRSSLVVRAKYCEYQTGPRLKIAFLLKSLSQALKRSNKNLLT
jgi:hypothetical protein